MNELLVFLFALLTVAAAASLVVMCIGLAGIALVLVVGAVSWIIIVTILKVIFG